MCGCWTDVVIIGLWNFHWPRNPNPCTLYLSGKWILLSMNLCSIFELFEWLLNSRKKKKGKNLRKNYNIIIKVYCHWTDVWFLNARKKKKDKKMFLFLKLHVVLLLTLWCNICCNYKIFNLPLILVLAQEWIRHQYFPLGCFLDQSEIIFREIL